MIQNEFENNLIKTEDLITKNVCDLRYLTEMMGHKKHLIKGVIDTFLKQIQEELDTLDNAIKSTDYPTIKSYAHTMKSSVSIMGISILAPILLEMQNLGASFTNIDKIRELNITLNSVCKKAIAEIEIEKHNYV